MKALAALVLVLAAGCFSGSSSGKSAGTGGTRLGVMPMLSELPTDAQKRDAILDQSHETAGPEQRKGQTVKERQAETAAASVAAILGSMFSTTQTTTLGAASTFDENQIIAPSAPQPRRPVDGTQAPPAEPVDPVQLVPWVKIGPGK